MLKGDGRGVEVIAGDDESRVVAGTVEGSLDMVVVSLMLMGGCEGFVSGGRAAERNLNHQSYLLSKDNRPSNRI